MFEENETQTGHTGERFAQSSRFFDPEDEVSLRDLALVPWKRRGIVAGCTAFCVAVAILICIFMHPRYKATATIELNQEKSSGGDALSSLASLAGGDSDELKTKIDTEIAVIKDDSIALAVMNNMGMLRLENPDRFSKEAGPLVSPEALPATRRESLVGNFKEHLEVKELESSRLIAITYTDRDPVQAAKIANQVVAEYKSYLLNSNFSSSKEVSQWLSAQLGDLSDQVAKSQQAVADFEHTHNLSSAMLGLSTLGGSSASASGVGGGGGGGGGSVSIPELERLTALNEEVTQAEAARLGHEAIYRLASTENPDVISSLGSRNLLKFTALERISW